MRVTTNMTAVNSMKTLIFCTGWSNEQDNWNTYKNWLGAIGGSNLKYNQILIPDDGSVVLPSFGEIIGELPDIQPKGDIVVYHWEQNLGRPSHLDYPGWYRSFMFAATYASRYGFEKVVHIESDARIISERLQLYINSVIDGWAAFWCPRHSFPETGIQIIAGESMRRYVELSKTPYEFFIGQHAEGYLPVTVVYNFIGDRYGEYLPTIPENADYAVQVR